MVAEHLSHERACVEELCRLFEGLGQGVYSRRGALIRFDPAKIRAAGLSPITPVIVLNDENATVVFS